MCDLNSQEERRDGLIQAREEELTGLTMIIATPNPKREAWVLNGFICQTSSEKRELETICREINIHPCQEAHRLRYTSHGSQAARDPKKILLRLTGGNHEREEECWRQTALPTLCELGRVTMLKDFLDEVESTLMPLFSK